LAVIAAASMAAFLVRDANSPLWSYQVASAYGALVTVVPSVGRGGGEGVAGGLLSFAGEGGAGVGEDGVAGGEPPGTDEFEEVDDEGGGLFGRCVVFRSGRESAPVE